MTRDARQSETLLLAAVCIFLVLAVLAVFGQTAGFGFVNYDDNLYVYDNPVVEKGLTWPGALWALSYGGIGHWHPLTWLTHMADCQIFGLWAGGHHLTNAALHAAATVILFLVLRRLTGMLWRSAFVAAVFAVHPLRAESVAWIAERKDVLSGLFFMLTLLAYANYARRPSRGRYLVMALLFALGLLSKNMLVTLPFVLLLLDWWPLGRMKTDGPGLRTSSVGFWALVKEKIPLLLLSVGCSVATALAPETVAPGNRVAVLARVGNAVISYVIYLRQMFFPSGLANLYPFHPNDPPLWQVGVALVVLAGITAAVVACRQTRPYLLVGWLWYLGMLVPVIGIVQISYYAHADRYTYLPGIGPALAVTWAVADGSAGWKHRRLILGAALAAVLGALAWCGHFQTSYWRDSESLWRRALACTTGNYVAHKSLGDYAYGQGRLDDAIVQYEEALAINPDYGEALNNLGVVLFARGDLEGAIAKYRKAVEVRPDFAEARNSLGAALFARGDQPGAIAQYRQALELKPDYTKARNNLGASLLAKGDLNEAVEQLQKVLAAQPTLGGARTNLGKALLRKGDFDGALASFDGTGQTTSAARTKWPNLGDSLLQEQDWDDAILCYQHALQTNPRSAETCGHLGLALIQKGKTKEAIDAWEKSLEIIPDQVYVQENLAWVLATARDPALRNGAKAVALAKRADQSSGGGNPVILHTLAAAYAEAGNYGEAAAAARRALTLAVNQKQDALAATLQMEIKLYETNPPK